MVGWHHQLNRHEFEQAPGDERQGNMECCNPWGRKESDTTELLNKQLHSPPTMQVALDLPYFLRLNNIPLYEYTTLAYSFTCLQTLALLVSYGSCD